MLKVIIAAAAIVLASYATAAAKTTHVEGYVRKDGTYVAPHERSAPDRSYNNNWSTTPNINPYTGQQGSRSPTLNDRPPETNPYGSLYGTAPRR
jgi:hypothetical protein